MSGAIARNVIARMGGSQSQPRASGREALLEQQLSRRFEDGHGAVRYAVADRRRSSGGTP